MGGLNLQSPHELRWVLVAWVPRVCGVTTPLLHHQPVLNVHIQGIFSHNLGRGDMGTST